MAKFIPGAIVKEFITPKGDNATVRYPRWEDLDKLLSYINTLSKEDTFISYSGEQLTKEEEAEFLCDVFKEIEFGNKVYLNCHINQSIIASCKIERHRSENLQYRHIGLLSIAVAHESRGVGIGFEIAHATIAEAKKRIEGLKIIALEVYGHNTKAIDLYKRLGFRERARISDGVYYKGSYVENVLMNMKI